MYFFRLLSAFIFACVGIFFVYLGVWHFSIKKMEELLPEKLNAVFGVEVSYSGIKQNLNPLKMEMVIQGLEISDQAEAGEKYTYKIGDAVLKAEFWSFDKLAITFPEYQSVVVSKGGVDQEFAFLGGNSTLDIYLQDFKLKDFFFSVNNFSLQGKGVEAPFVEGDYVYYSCMNAGSECGLTFTSLTVLGEKFDVITSAWQVLQKREGGLTSFLVNVLSARNLKAIDVLESAMKDQSLEVQVLSSHIERDGLWVSGNGVLDLSEGGILNGEMSVTSNDQRAVLDHLASKGLLDKIRYDKLALIRSLISGGRKSYTVGYSLAEGKFLVNGDVAGDVINVKSLLNGVRN